MSNQPVTIPGNDIICECMFVNCKNFNQLVIPSISTLNFTDIFFDGCLRVFNSQDRTYSPKDNKYKRRF